jgi:hypothetical protein
MLINRISCIAAVLISLGTSATAHADVITFQFGGQLTSVPAPLSATFSMGQAYSASFTLDSSAPPILSNPVVAKYPLVFAQVKIGSYVAAGVPNALNGITIENDHVVTPAPTFDQWLGSSLFSGPAVNGKVVGFGDVDLEDSITHTAFSSTALPSALDLSKFNTRGFSLSFCDSFSGVTCVGGGDVLGSVDTVSVTSAAVPQPPSLALLAIAGLVLLGVGRMKRSQSSGWGE